MSCELMLVVPLLPHRPSLPRAGPTAFQSIDALRLSAVAPVSNQSLLVSKDTSLDGVLVAGDTSVDGHDDSMDDSFLPTHDEESVVIPELPQGSVCGCPEGFGFLQSSSCVDVAELCYPLFRLQHLQIEVISTWGDPSFVGMTGVELFDELGAVIVVEHPTEQVPLTIPFRCVIPFIFCSCFGGCSPFWRVLHPK